MMNKLFTILQLYYNIIYICVIDIWSKTVNSEVCKGTKYSCLSPTFLLKNEINDLGVPRFAVKNSMSTWGVTG